MAYGIFCCCQGLDRSRSGVNRVKGKKPSPFSSAGGFFGLLGGGELCPGVIVRELGSSVGDGAESQPSKSGGWGSRPHKEYEGLSLYEIRPLERSPCAVANCDHPYLLPMFIEFIDDAVDVGFLAVEQVPQLSL